MSKGNTARETGALRKALEGAESPAEFARILGHTDGGKRVRRYVRSKGTYVSGSRGADVSTWTPSDFVDHFAPVPAPTARAKAAPKASA